MPSVCPSVLTRLNNPHYLSKVFVCVSVISGRVQITAWMRSSGFWSYISIFYYCMTNSNWFNLHIVDGETHEMINWYISLSAIGISLPIVITCLHMPCFRGKMHKEIPTSQDTILEGTQKESRNSVELTKFTHLAEHVVVVPSENPQGKEIFIRTKG